MRIVVGVAAVALLAGCSSAPASSSASPSVVSLDEVYLSHVRQILATATDSERLAVRETVCSDLRATPTQTEWLVVVKALMDTYGLSARDAGTVTGAAIASGCPDVEGVAPSPS